jgi:hypothetical protein
MMEVCIPKSVVPLPSCHSPNPINRDAILMHLRPIYQSQITSTKSHSIVDSLCQYFSLTYYYNYVRILLKYISKHSLKYGTTP